MGCHSVRQRGVLAYPSSLYLYRLIPFFVTDTVMAVNFAQTNTAMMCSGHLLFWERLYFDVAVMEVFKEAPLA